MRRNHLVLSGLAALSVLSAVTLSPGSPAVAAAAPSFRTYVAPQGLGDRAGEPTLGINPKTGAVLFQAYTETLRVTGFDAAGPGTSTWELGKFPIPQEVSFDPILRTDPDTGRTFTSQLLLACSQAGFTDDDGRSFTPSTGCGPGALFDHQSVGFGKYVKGSLLPRTPTSTYPNVVYYCAQATLTSNCSMSTDGGITFPITRPAYTSAECLGGAIFGHIKSDPTDGTVYLPPRFCLDAVTVEAPVGVSVSTDNGLSWKVRTVPGSVLGDAGHSSVGIGRKDGAVYLAYGAPRDGKTLVQSGPPAVAVSRDKGETWAKPVVLGSDVGIENTRFPVAVAGDPGRAAIGFLGSTTAGNGGQVASGNQKAFAGRWDLYVSFTADYGKTWKTVNATPDHPVQVGPICTSGTTCGSSRNLLDFNDAVVDPGTGRVVVAFADGCPGADAARCTDAVRDEKATIARQVAGPSLFSAAAPKAGTAPSQELPRAAPKSAPAGGALAATGPATALMGLGLILLLLGGQLSRRRRPRT